MRKGQKLILQGFRCFFYYVVAVPILAILCRVVFGLEIRGREHLSSLKGAVLICNHVHYLDSAMVAVAAWGRHVTFATLDQNFKLPIVGWLLKQFGCIPVGTSLKGTKLFLEQSEQLLREEKLVGIFPEGNLQEYHSSLQKFQRGAFLLAAKTEVPVVPMTITQRPVQWYRKFFHRKPFLTLQIGAPLIAPEGMGERERAQFLQEKAYKEMSIQLEIMKRANFMEVKA